MNEILLNILSVTVTAVILPLITLLGSKLVNWISQKAQNEASERLLSTATSIILSAVKSVFQTYVEALKKEGRFDAESQRVALNQALQISLSQMTDDVKAFIQSSYGDVEAWITTQIEATINSLKN